MEERAPWPPRRSRAEEHWRPRALMYDFEVEVTTVQTALNSAFKAPFLDRPDTTSCGAG